jgi:hypothetical protein
MFQNRDQTLKGLGVWRTLFRVKNYFLVIPRVLEDSNRGLKLANAFGVIKLTPQFLIASLHNFKWAFARFAARTPGFMFSPASRACESIRGL